MPRAACSDIRIEPLGEARFAAMRDPWQALLARSGADPLFLSWAWQYSWWQTWGHALGLELVLLAAWRGDALVGLAPLYQDRVRVGSLRGLRRLQFIGNAWQRAPTVRTEYLDFLVEPALREAVLAALLEHLLARVPGWDELVICDFDRASPNFAPWCALCERRGVGVFERKVEAGVRVDTAAGFGTWLGGLGRNTRLKLYNRRRELESHGEVRLVLAGAGEAPDYFTVLNRLHAGRWGRPCFEGASLAFHLAMLERLEGGSEALRFSRLEVGGEVVSALYDIRAGGREYNLQAGYQQDYDRKLSLGTLHLGYAIEQAFADAGTGSFDLLAGSGKNSFYKDHFGGRRVEFVTLQLVRNRTVAGLYRFYFALVAPLRRRWAASRPKDGR